MRLTAATLGLIFSATSSFAALAEFPTTSTTEAGKEFTFDVSVPTTVFGDAYFTFSAFGDIGNRNRGKANEFVDVYLDGQSYGSVFDHDTTNDDFDLYEILNPTDVANGAAPLFDTIAGDAPLQNQLVIAQLVIPELAFASLIADGMITVTLDYSQQVSEVTTGGNFSFDEVAPVPLPASVGFLGLGLAGLGALRARRKSKTKAV